MNAHVYRLSSIVVVVVGGRRRRPSAKQILGLYSLLLLLVVFVAFCCVGVAWCALLFAIWWFACKILHTSLWRYSLQPGCSDFRQSLYHRFVRSTYPFDVGINMKSKYPISRAQGHHGPRKFRSSRQKMTQHDEACTKSIAPTTPLSMN